MKTICYHNRKHLLKLVTLPERVTDMNVLHHHHVAVFTRWQKSRGLTWHATVYSMLQCQQTRPCPQHKTMNGSPSCMMQPWRKTIVS
ncbi:hypothetical protein BDR07DRAFT_247187 [Suillus spraguei]|nr:hypothetical protein BDR07DRAFT_247187 [Suillus spraguei]